MERHTRQRQAVLDALVRSGQALSPQDLLGQAKSAVPSLNLSTVYRQLRTLHDEAQVVRVDLPGQAARFEAPCAERSAHAHEHHHHHHFHCTVCDRVFPIHGCPSGIDRLAPAGFRVEQHELTLRGRCADCARAA